MASAESLKKLFRSYGQANSDEFYSAAMQLIAEEEKLHHNVLARDLKRLLENGSSKPANSIHFHELQRLPHDRERGAALVEVRSPSKYLPELIVSEELAAQIDQILTANPDKVAEYQAGRDKLLQFFVGQAMRATQGKANPQMLNELLKKKLSEKN